MTPLGQLAEEQEPQLVIFSQGTLFDRRPDIGLLANVSSQVTALSANYPPKDTVTDWYAALSSRAYVHSGTASVEMDWLTANAQELSKYAGEWLLIQGRVLLAHSNNFRRLRAIIEDRAIRSPFVYYVPTDEESNSVTI
jgi:hypothetical protein